METIRIGDACKILNGYAFKSDKYVTSGIRVIRIANVQKGYIEDADPEFYPENYSGLDKYMLKEGDLLMSLTGNVGRVAILQKEMLPAALNQRVACLRIKNPKISKGYLFRFLNSDYFENKCIQASKGVAQKNVSTEWLKEYEIPLYSAKKQAEIENTLDKLNLVIKHRKEELSDLDELIKARFVEMFGDPIINPRELPVSDLGHLSELITKGASPSWQGFSYTDDATQTLFVTSENVREGYIDISSPKYIEDDFNEKQRRSVLQKGDFLINIVGASIGRAAQFTLDCKANINQAVALVRIEDKRIRDRYLLVYLNSEKAQQMYNSMKSDTGRANLSLQDISNLSILLPPVEEQITFENFVTQVDKSKVAVQKSLDETQLLFNSLMQKYFG